MLLIRMMHPLSFRIRGRHALIAILIALIVLGLFAPFIVLAQSEAPPTVTDSCSGTWWSFSLKTFDCYFRQMVVGISIGLLYMMSWVLYVAAALFNLLVEHTIINFGGFIYSDPVRAAVETAWTAFRDISNIVIIGMFVFFAIAMILGSTEYGWRTYIPRVIIVAVFINFSLLFASMIIDFSNFTATQVYNATGLQAGAAASTGAGGAGGASAGATNNDKGIAGAYLHMLGVGTFADTANSVRQAAAANDSGWTALLHGVAGSLFMIVAAIVFLYGSFLLISRALLLIFLLLSSALAFASLLIPAKFASNWGWDAWLGSLLRAAVFAPLLMVMLWITLRVGQALKAGQIGSSAGTLGRLESDPATTGNLYALLMYIIMIALLYITMKVSSSFSKTIGGFGIASYLPGLAGRIATTQAFGALSWAGKNTFGRAAYSMGQKAEDASKNESYSKLNRSLFKFASDTFMKGAKSDMNLLKTSAAKGIGSAIGAQNVDKLLGKAKGGFKGDLDNNTKRILSMMTEEEKQKQLDKIAADEAAKKAAKADKDAAKSPEQLKQEQEMAQPRAVLQNPQQPPAPETQGKPVEEAALSEAAQKAAAAATGQAQGAQSAQLQNIQQEKNAKALAENQDKMREDVAKQATEAAAKQAVGATGTRGEETKMMQQLSKEERTALEKSLKENSQAAQEYRSSEESAGSAENAVGELKQELRKMTESNAKEMHRLGTIHAERKGYLDTHSSDMRAQESFREIETIIKNTHSEHKSALGKMARDIADAQKKAVESQRELTEKGRQILKEAREREAARLSKEDAIAKAAEQTGGTISGAAAKIDTAVTRMGTQTPPQQAPSPAADFATNPLSLGNILRQSVGKAPKPDSILERNIEKMIKAEKGAGQLNKLVERMVREQMQQNKPDTDEKKE